jgi:hypothetical protein
MTIEPSTRRERLSEAVPVLLSALVEVFERWWAKYFRTGKRGQGVRS